MWSGLSPGQIPRVDLSVVQPAPGSLRTTPVCEVDEPWVDRGKQMSESSCIEGERRGSKDHRADDDGND